MVGNIETSFRSALGRMAKAGRLVTYSDNVSIKNELAGLLKAGDGGQAMIFPDVAGFDMPVVGNFLASPANCEAAFGLDARGIREAIERGVSRPVAPLHVDDAPVQQIVETQNFDIGTTIPALHHAPEDGGRFITAGIVIVKDPQTGIYNASYHRLHLLGPNLTGIKLDFGRHLRLAFERARAAGEPLSVAVALGADLGLLYTAATMGSQMPEDADELAVAGGLAGRPLDVTRAMTQDLLVPAHAEIVLEGQLMTGEEVVEGPFGEFVGFAAPAGPGPVFKVTALTSRERPIYHAINGYGRETIMLRKYVLEASLLKALRPAVPIVVDAEMTAGGLHRFHAVLQVKKQIPQHEGLQRNAILAAFGALKDLDLVVAVDEDIDLRDPLDVEYALATRIEASRDVFMIPGARGHEYVRAGNNGIRTKMGIDATVPFEDKQRFSRVQFADVTFDPLKLSQNEEVVMAALGLERDF